MSAMNVRFVIFNLTCDSVLCRSTVREFFLCVPDQNCYFTWQIYSLVHHMRH